MISRLKPIISSLINLLSLIKISLLPISISFLNIPKKWSNEDPYLTATVCSVLSQKSKICKISTRAKLNILVFTKKKKTDNVFYDSLRIVANSQ